MSNSIWWLAALGVVCIALGYGMALLSDHNLKHYNNDPQLRSVNQPRGEVVVMESSKEKRLSVMTIHPVTGEQATHCITTATSHRPKPRRFVWHHTLPQVCGGNSENTKIVSLCDNCHYAIHDLLYLLANYELQEIHQLMGLLEKECPNEMMRQVVWDGYQQAAALNVLGKIPKES